MQPTADQLLRVSELITLTAETVRLFTAGAAGIDGQGGKLIEVAFALRQHADEVAAIARTIDQKTA